MPLLVKNVVYMYDSLGQLGKAKEHCQKAHTRLILIKFVVMKLCMTLSLPEGWKAFL
jgi:hypothetical protein